MARRDPPDLQVLGGVPGQLENLVGEIQTSTRAGCKLGGYVWTLLLERRHDTYFSINYYLESLLNLGSEILEDASTIDSRSTSDSSQPLFTLHLD